MEHQSDRGDQRLLAVRHAEPGDHEPTRRRRYERELVAAVLEHAANRSRAALGGKHLQEQSTDLGLVDLHGPCRRPRAAVLAAVSAAVLAAVTAAVSAAVTAAVSAGRGRARLDHTGRARTRRG